MASTSAIDKSIDKKPFLLSLLNRVMWRLFIALTFESLDEIVFCYHTKMKPL